MNRNRIEISILFLFIFYSTHSAAGQSPSIALVKQIACLCVDSGSFLGIFPPNCLSTCVRSNSVDNTALLITINVTGKLALLSVKNSHREANANSA